MESYAPPPELAGREHPMSMVNSETYTMRSSTTSHPFHTSAAGSESFQRSVDTSFTPTQAPPPELPTVPPVPSLALAGLHRVSIPPRVASGEFELSTEGRTPAEAETELPPALTPYVVTGTRVASTHFEASADDELSVNIGDVLTIHAIYTDGMVLRVLFLF